MLFANKKYERKSAIPSFGRLRYSRPAKKSEINEADSLAKIETIFKAASNQDGAETIKSPDIDLTVEAIWLEMARIKIAHPMAAQNSQKMRRNWRIHPGGRMTISKEF